jgi:hypothetical protein
MNDVAVLVCEQLNLDVAPTFDQLFEVQAPVRKAGERFCLCGIVGVFHVSDFADDPHPATTATTLRLQQNRKSGRPRNVSRLSDVPQHPIAAGDDLQPRFRHRSLGRRLAAELLHHSSRRTDEGHSVRFAQRREQRVLGEESPPGVEHAALGLHRGLHDPLPR